MSGKTALVTGATGFLGRQVVKAFASHDWTVKGTGFSRADGTDILKVDLADAAEIEEALEKVKYVPPAIPSTSPLNHLTFLTNPRRRPQVVIHCTYPLPPSPPLLALE
jgi:NAD(P)-dependent dehydrogenase (short-subunit alcohol dehydrogenase family)